MICLIELGRIPSWIVVIIVAREFVISGFRLIAAEQGVVIAANYWGKFKTVSQMVMTALLILHLGDTHHTFRVIEIIFICLATILTVVSLADYIWKNRDLILSGGI